MCQTTSIGLVLLLAVSVSCRNVPASSALKSSPSASVEPSSAYAYLKGRLDLTLEFDEPPAPLTGCFVQMPGSKSFELLPNEALVLNSEGRLAALYKLADGRCGVRVQPVENADDGVWKLKAVFSTSPPTDVEASATVTVKAYSDSVMPDLPSVSEGESFSLRLITLSPTAWSTCTVELPSGERIQVAPPDTAAESGSRIRFEGDGSGDDPKALCAVHVGSAGATDAGRWVLEATEQATGVVKRGMARVTVYMASMAVLPAKVAAEEGESTLFSLVFNDAKLAAGRQWTGCQAKRPDGKLVQLRGSGPDQDESGLVVDATVRVAEGPCAVQIGPLEKRHTGTWTLSAMEKGTSPTTRRAVAALVVKGPYVPVAANVSMTTGLLHVSFVCGPTDALSCTLSDPSGSETDFRGPCSHTLDRVREKHRGVWNCSALVKGYSGPVKDTVDVQINDPVHTEMAVTRTPAGVVLTCRLAGSSACSVKPTTCRFDPPTGPPLLVREAVLTQGRYSYAGRGLAACDCSMAIQAPLVPEDLGVWRCIIEFDNLRPRGGLAEVTADGSRGQRNTVGEAGTELRAGTVAIHPVLEPSSGIVEPDATLKVGCRATRSLAYCWLRTPHGELLAVDENWRLEDNRGRYTGLGLELGECGIQVVASANHTGTWQCGVGLTGSGQAAMQDLELTLAVTVSESVLVAQQPSVTAFAGSGNSEAAVLVCRTAMDEGLRYCRFQRPDGSSILLADADSDRQGDEVGRLQYFGRAYGGLARGLCGVTISPVAEEDFGEWTCAVRLAGDVAGKEQNAVVQLLRAEQDIAEAALVGAGVGLVLVAAITAAVIWSRHYRKSRLRHRGASPQSWLSDGDSEDLVMDVRNSPSPTSSTGGRSNRRRTATMLASGMATMRLRARTQRPNRTTRTRASSSTQQMPRAASDGAESGAVGTESPGGGL